MKFALTALLLLCFSCAPPGERLPAPPENAAEEFCTADYEDGRYYKYVLQLKGDSLRLQAERNAASQGNAPFDQTFFIERRLQGDTASNPAVYLLLKNPQKNGYTYLPTLRLPGGQLRADLWMLLSEDWEYVPAADTLAARLESYIMNEPPAQMHDLYACRSYEEMKSWPTLECRTPEDFRRHYRAVMRHTLQRYDYYKKNYIYYQETFRQDYLIASKLNPFASIEAADDVFRTHMTELMPVFDSLSDCSPVKELSSPESRERLRKLRDGVLNEK